MAAASLAFGCSLEDRPSLGRYEPPPAPASNAADNGGMQPSTVGQVTGTGGVASPPITSASVDSGQHHPTMPVADAGGALQPDAASLSDAAVIDAPRCVGVYAGDFTCTPDPPIVNPPIAMTPVTLTLRATQTAEIANATAPLSFAYAGFAFAGDITGTLDCTTSKFHARIANGIFASQVAPIPFAFDGMIDGAIDQATHTLAGSWSFSSPDFGGSCTGTWGAKLQP